MCTLSTPTPLTPHPSSYRGTRRWLTNTPSVPPTITQRQQERGVNLSSLFSVRKLYIPKSSTCTQLNHQTTAVCALSPLQVHYLSAQARCTSTSHPGYLQPSQPSLHFEYKTRCTTYCWKPHSHPNQPCRRTQPARYLLSVPSLMPKIT